jgi:hypothetical protein
MLEMRFPKTLISHLLSQSERQNLMAQIPYKAYDEESGEEVGQEKLKKSSVFSRLGLGDRWAQTLSVAEAS